MKLFKNGISNFQNTFFFKLQYALQLETNVNDVIRTKFICTFQIMVKTQLAGISMSFDVAFFLTVIVNEVLKT